MFLFLLLCVFAHAEQKWAPQQKNTLQVTGGISIPGLDFVVKGPGPDVTYVPNNPGLPFLSVAYRNLGVTAQFPTRPDEKSLREKGASNISDYQFRFFGHRSTHEIIYQYFQGYSMQGWKDSNGDPYIRPDINIRHVAYNYISALSPGNFSKAVAFDQKGTQLKQGGSFFLWGGLGFTELQSQGPLIPESVQIGRSHISDLSDFRMYSFLLGIAYGHLWPVFTRYYFTLSAFAGLGPSWQKTNLWQYKEWDIEMLNRIGVRTGLGYNYEKHLGGIQLIVDSNSVPVADGEFGQSTLNIRLFYGYRFQNILLPWIN